MDRTTFLGLLAKKLYPVLRSEGFAGSGSTLRRINGPLLHVFNVQGSKGGESFYVNLGSTLAFLQMHGVDANKLSSAKEYECVFRTRLDPPNEPYRGWRYGSSEVEADEIISTLMTTWQTKGQPWFGRYTNFPDDFNCLVQAESAMHEHPAHLLVLAQIALHLGHRERGRAIAAEGLRRVPERATSLKHDFHVILEQHDTA